MKDSKTALAKNEPREAVTPQEKAKAELPKPARGNRQLIEKLQKETERSPRRLGKGRGQARQVDRTTKGDARNATDDIAKEAKNDQLPKATAEQRQLARDTAELKNEPLPGQEKIEPALEKAEKAMKDAIKDLVKKQAEPAVPKQDKGA